MAGSIDAAGMPDMGAGPWTIYNKAKQHLMGGGIDLDTDSFALSLYQSGSNALDVTKEVVGEISAEVANGNGYTTGGQTLTNVTWAVGSTASEMRFTATDLQWQATGTGIGNVQYAVIWRKGTAANVNYLLCCAALDENGPFSTPGGNPLAVNFSDSGIFELN